MEKISIVTPSYNIIKDWRLDYFHKMMSGVHNQTYKKIEHIFIDWASDDWTLELLNNYKEKWLIDKIISEEDSWIYSAMNKWIKESSGDYVNIMNTDDYLTDLDYFRKSVNALKWNNIDFVHADRLIESRNWDSLFVKKWDLNSFAYRMPIRHQTFITNKKVIDEIWLFSEDYNLVSDYKFMLEMLLAWKKWFYFDKLVLKSLDWWASSDREKCIEEVSDVIFNTYWGKFWLTREDCIKIYKQEISFDLKMNILNNVKNEKILNSLREIF